MSTCDDTRQCLSAIRDGEEHVDAPVEHHLSVCVDCTEWLDRVDHATRALRLYPLPQPAFVDRALALWDQRHDQRLGHAFTVGRAMLSTAALGCLIVGVLIAAGSAGHTHIGVTAQREVIILEVALAFGLACAAARPRTFLPGIVPVLVVVAVVNLSVSLINLVTQRSGLIGELAHLPFVVGLIGSWLVHRADPIRLAPTRGARQPAQA